MATYKVIQDVEAEDKILGPLSLKQLIFAAIAAGAIFLAFRIVMATGAFYAAIPFLPIILVFGILAAPLGRDQPTEMWLAAQIRFFTKPRVRIWDQSDIKHLVTITAPVRIEKVYTDGLNQDQVKSRLKALSTTLDSRGWAAKNVDINLFATSGYATATDRLIDPNSLPVAVSDVDIRASDDILDADNNQTAHYFDELMETSNKAYHESLVNKIHTAAAQQSQQSMPSSQVPNPAPSPALTTQPSITPPQDDDNDDNADDNNDVTADESSDTQTTSSLQEQQVLKHAKQEQARAQMQSNTHHKVVLTAGQQAAQALEEEQALQRADEPTIEDILQLDPEPAAAQETETHLSKADTIELANANLKVSTIAGLAKHKTDDKRDSDEVVIKLR